MEIIRPKVNSRWEIRNGKFFRHFLDRLDSGFDEEAKNKLIDETSDILAACENPNTKNQFIKTGSAVGYVQSGKTTSFKALSLLALDNGYDFVIVLGGRNNPLLNQNKKEFADLLMPLLEGESVEFFEASEISEIKQIPLRKLAKNRGFFDKEPVPIITVILKHQGHLSELAKQLSARNNSKTISETNVLIIDDEADNASLNGLIQEEEGQTAIYRELTLLRDNLPRHSLVQYTATPQALLLASKNDHYSPDWVRVITPGKAYIGGDDLFNEDAYQSLAIPEEDLIGLNKNDLEGFDKLPNSFLHSLREFLLVCCQCKKSQSIFDNNVTMLVHPGVETDVHLAWQRKIKGTLDDWRLEAQEEPFRWKKDNKDSFLKVYKGLKQSAGKKLDKFSTLYDLIPKLLDHGINVIALNSSKKAGSQKQISWHEEINIIVGATLVDRGYVVKGLVTTYMPRGPGGGNVDAIQQRGRFYGYKRKYLEFIRIRLASDLLLAYRSYAVSEKDLYNRLKEFSKKNVPFQSWERVMIMDPSLRPCRANVIGIDLAETVPTRGSWYFPAFPSHSTFNQNQEIFQKLIDDEAISFSSYEAEKSETWSTEASCIHSPSVSLDKILQYFTQLQVSRSDSNRWQAVKLTIGWLRDKGFKADIFLMGTRSVDLKNFALRRRTLPVEGSALTSTIVFQGRNSKNKYPGARQIFNKSDDVLSIQIHKLKIVTEQSEGEVIIPCIRVPEKIKVITEK